MFNGILYVSYSDSNDDDVIGLINICEWIKQIIIHIFIYIIKYKMIYTHLFYLIKLYLYKIYS